MTLSVFSGPTDVSFQKLGRIKRPVLVDKRRMTVIAAQFSQGRILFGSDSLVVDGKNDIKSTYSKVSRLPGRSLVWGFAGDEGVGFRFRDWLLAYQLDPSMDWPTFADVASRALSQFNGEKRQRAKLAGVELKDEDTASVLIAGAVGGVLDVWQLDDGGSADSQKHRGFVGIGSGWPHAFLSYTTLVTYAKADGANPQVVWIGLEMSARFSSKCDVPVLLYEVTDSSVTRIGPDGRAIIEEGNAASVA